MTPSSHSRGQLVQNRTHTYAPPTPAIPRERGGPGWGGKGPVRPYCHPAHGLLEFSFTNLDVRPND